MNQPTAHELARSLSVLEERMNTKQAEYKTDIARLAEQIAQRDKDNMRWNIGLWIATMVVPGFLIRLPG